MPMALKEKPSSSDQAAPAQHRPASSLAASSPAPKYKLDFREHPAAKMVAARYQHLVPAGQSVLFHGTRKPAAILVQDRLTSFCSSGDHMISFTRALHIGVHWGMTCIDFTDEPTGAVLVFDRALLEESYHVRSYHDPVCDDEGLYGSNYFEAEEVVRRRHIKDLSRYLLTVIWLKPSECYGYWRKTDMLANKKKQRKWAWPV
jgi:hypothetical protein